MKKLVFAFLVTIFLFNSCSNDNTTTEQTNDFSNDPVSGKLYGSNFTMEGSKAALVTMFNIASVEIQLSSEDLGCEASSGSTNFPIRITAPRAVGAYTTDVYVTFNDPSSDNYVSVSNGSTIEITSITDTMVKGKIRASSNSNDNAINGTFEVPICQ